MRSFVVVCCSAVLPFALAYGCGGGNDELAPTPQQDGGKTDAKTDAKVDGTVPHDGSTVDGDATDLDAPPPIENDGDLFDGGPPPDGARVEKTIGPSGGTLVGESGSPLAGVVLEVPAGALGTDVTLAIDVGAGAPTAGTLISPLVKIGPDGTLFAKPARLTLPWSTGLSSPQLAMVARVGMSWSSLLDPAGDASAKTLTASMSRASAAGVVALDLSSTAPKIDMASSGTTIFLSGSGFGFAPVWRAGVDGGMDFVSNVTVGGTAAEVLAWEDTTVTIRTTATGAIVLTTPGGTSTAP